MDAEALAKKARRSIWEYCSAECHAYCCRKGYLVLTTKEADLITANMVIQFMKEERLIPLDNGFWSLFLGKTDLPCPMLKDFQCMIHDNAARPLACKEFPIFVEGNVVRLSGRCPAVKEGKFYSYISKWAAGGFKVIESDQRYDSDFWNNMVLKKDEDMILPKKRPAVV